MTYGRTTGMMTAAFMGVLLGIAVSAVLYILLVIASFFVKMPQAAQNAVVVGGLLAGIFTSTFLITFRKMISRTRR